MEWEDDSWAFRRARSLALATGVTLVVAACGASRGGPPPTDAPQLSAPPATAAAGVPSSSPAQPAAQTSEPLSSVPTTLSPELAAKWRELGVEAPETLSDPDEARYLTTCFELHKQVMELGKSAGGKSPSVAEAVENARRNPSSLAPAQVEWCAAYMTRKVREQLALVDSVREGKVVLAPMAGEHAWQAQPPAQKVSTTGQAAGPPSWRVGATVPIALQIVPSGDLENACNFREPIGQLRCAFQDRTSLRADVHGDASTDDQRLQPFFLPDVGASVLIAGLWHQPAVRALLEDERRTGKPLPRIGVSCQLSIEAVVSGGEQRWSAASPWIVFGAQYAGRVSDCSVSPRTPGRPKASLGATRP